MRNFFLASKILTMNTVPLSPHFFPYSPMSSEGVISESANEYNWLNNNRSSQTIDDTFG